MDALVAPDKPDDASHPAGDHFVEALEDEEDNLSGRAAAAIMRNESKPLVLRVGALKDRRRAG
jgi:hypothetical protein